MNSFMETLVSFLWGLPLILTIFFTGIYFTVRSGFFQFRFFTHIFSQTIGGVLRGEKSDEGAGIITPFQAVSTAIGGSVGVGNIGGVATAIATGGPGALFWLWIAALLGMIIKMAEVTLGVHYRSIDEKGVPYGGPTYYMEKGLGQEKGFKYWIIPAVLFGGGIFSTFFITVQNYTVSEAVSSTFGVNLLTASFIYIIFNYIMILKGISGLGRIAGKLVPFMCLFYIGSGMFIILTNLSTLPHAFRLIFEGAFNGTAAVGGFTGAAFIAVMRTGIARSVFSNEAGWGSSPMIHASAKTTHPVKQGLWGAFEVFVDTIVVCSITALVIIISGVWSTGLTGAALTLSAFETGMGTSSRVFLAVGIFLFGVTTSSGWYAYYEIILRHLMKKNLALKEKILRFYRIFYPVPGFLMVVIAVNFGMPGGTVWLFADITTAIPTFINVATILILSGKFFELLKDYKEIYIHGKKESTVPKFYEEGA